MATPKVFLGVSSKARSVSKIYVGVSGKARKVIRAYAGVSGKARLVYTSDFFLPSGVSLSNCIAAYKFKGASSATEAKKDLTGHGYNLTYGENVAWSSSRGFYKSGQGNSGVPWVYTNTNLTDQNIKSYVIYYGNYSGAIATSGAIAIPSGAVIANPAGAEQEGTVELLLGIGGANYTARFAISAGQIGLENTGTSSAWSSYPCFWYKKNYSNIMLGKSVAPASGVYGVTISEKVMYLNGTSKPLKDTYSDAQSAQEYIPGYNTSSKNWVINTHGCDVYGLALYKIDITQAQHKSIANAMLEF